MRVLSWQRLAIVVAVSAVGALGASGCPINPTIDPTGKTCGTGDLCPLGFDCYAGDCVASCDDGGCNAAGTPPTSVLSAVACHCTSDCPCPQVCVVDPYWVGLGVPTVCETQCDDMPGDGTAIQCIDPGSVCNGASCVVNTCANLFSACNAAGVGDGTCLTLLPDGGGQCIQGAPASSGNCSLDATRAVPNALCPEGKFCSPNVGDQGNCLPVCDPNNELNQCPQGGTCAQAAPGIPVSVCE